MSDEHYINPGIETLVELGFINRLVLAHGTEEKGARNEILNCLGCKLAQGDIGITGCEITECSGKDNVMVSTMLVKLERARLLISEKVLNESSPGYKKVYRIAETERGETLRNAIGVPPDCGLEK